MDSEVMSRKDFLKGLLFGCAGFFAFLKFGSVPAFANVPSASSNDGSVIRSSMAPLDHKVMWLNTGSGMNTEGVGGRSVPAGALCYWDEASDGWKPTAATWA